jgi:hypothetical protein
MRVQGPLQATRQRPHHCLQVCPCHLRAPCTTRSRRGFSTFSAVFKAAARVYVPTLFSAGLSVGSSHGLSSSGSTSMRDANQHVANRAATIKLSGVPSLNAEAAFDFLGVRSPLTLDVFTAAPSLASKV